jgi:Zn-dependent protease with chaperone function
MRPDFLVPILLPLASWPMARFAVPKLPPWFASWLLATGSLVLAAGSTVALLVQVFAGLSIIPTVANYDDFSAATLRGLDPVNVPVSFGCGLVLVMLLASLCRAALRYRRWSRRVHAELDAHTSEGGVIVLRGEDPLAFAIPGRGGRIVVSGGMLAALDARERGALLAHECAHLRLRHHLFAAIVAVSCLLNPLVRPLAGSARFALERWADEAAARRVGDRTLVAVTVAKAALASGSGDSFVLAAGGGAVPRRVEALLSTPSPRPGRAPLALLAAAFVTVVAASSVGTALDSATDLHTGIELAQAASCGYGIRQPVLGQGSHGQPSLAAVRHHHRKCTQR